MSAAAAARESARLRLAAFFGVSAFAAIAYGGLVQHAPTLGVLGADACATACGAVLLAACSRLRRRLATPLAACALAASLALGLAAVGAPPALLAPARWGTLAADVKRGVDALGPWVWPYDGPSRWARLSVLMLLATALTLLSAVCFWPSPRALAARWLLALAAWVALTVAGLANEAQGAWRVEGVALALLLFAWSWLPSVRGRDAARAAGWTAVCLLAALLLAPALAGAGSWLDLRGSTVEPSAQFEWDQLYGPLSRTRTTQALLTVSADAPPLLRVTSLDRFDGVGFVRSAAPPQTLSLDLAPARVRRGWLERYQIGVGALSSSLLVGGEGVTAGVRFAGRGPQSLTAEGDGTIALASALTPGESYELYSYAPEPTAAQLRSAPASVPAAYLPYLRWELPAHARDLSAATDARLARDRPPSPAQTLVEPEPGAASASPAGRAQIARILSSPYAPVFRLARRLAARQPTAYDVVESVERYLRSRYSYDEHPPRRALPLLGFLFTDRRGYCQQFSGAMALMLRMDGIPARIGVGFEPSRLESGRSRWAVVASDAHAWVEVPFVGYGWVSFDPTPPRPSQAGPATAPASRAEIQGGASAEAQGRPAQLVPAAARDARPVSTSAWLIASVALAAVLLCGASLLLLRRVRRAGGAVLSLGRTRRPPWMRPRAAFAGDAAAAVEELRRALALDPSLPVAATLTEVARRFERRAQLGAAEYVRLLQRSRYARPDPACMPGSNPARSASLAKMMDGRAALRRALARDRGLRGRLRAHLELPPGFVRAIERTDTSARTRDGAPR